MMTPTPVAPFGVDLGLPGAGQPRWTGFLPFLAVALLLHLAVLALTTPGSTAAGGGGGDATISLQGATPALTAMVAEWERAPTVAPPPNTPPMAPAQPDTLPPLPDAPTNQTTLPDLAALPVAALPPDTPLAASEAPATLPRLGAPAADLPAPRTDDTAPPPAAEAQVPAEAPRLTALPRAADSGSALPDSAAPLSPLSMPVAPSLPSEPTPERPAFEPVLPEAPTQRLSGLAPMQAPEPATQSPPTAQASTIDSAPPLPAGALDARAQQLAPERSRLPEPRPAQLAAQRPAQTPAQTPAQSRSAQSDRPAQPATPPRQTAPAATPPAQAAAPSTRAAGTGTAPREGGSGRATATSRAGEDSTALVAQWGGAIRAAVQRQQRHPQGVRSGGTVHLQLAVNASGQLASVQMTQSSGHAALDRAAMEAVRRARLPSAPQGLSGTYRFNLPVRFRG